MCWRREKSLPSTGIRTSDRPARSVVAVPNGLPWVSSDYEAQKFISSHLVVFHSAVVEQSI